MTTKGKIVLETDRGYFRVNTCSPPHNSILSREIALSRVDARRFFVCLLLFLLYCHQICGVFLAHWNNVKEDVIPNVKKYKYLSILYTV